MHAVVLTGSAGALGRRVLARLAAHPDVSRVVAIDVVDHPEPVPAGVEVHNVDLLRDDLLGLVEGCHTVVHLASVFGPERRGERAAVDVTLTGRVLDVAAAARVSQVVLMSSATVYGAWADNPIPLTEDAPLRPNEGFDFAVEKLEIEHLVDVLRGRCPEMSVAVLRPTVALAEDARSWVSAALASAAAVRAGDLDPPSQFLHFDDLADAVVLAAERGLDGAFNVAPDRWIPPDSMHGFGSMPRLRVPVWVADRLARWRWRLGLSPVPPEILPWTIHPWVVANDRLRAEGWVPAFSNEEAYVTGTAPSPLETLSPKRRQELALTVAGGALVAGAVGVVALVRRYLSAR
ncbi:MAG: NAD-dependent epimerase/dehydratase family protein [Acidimicrobiia bacterium]|nr:NAD-dependent epimerase/dehydratase family protein [Acidimicrobiia bacterium]